MMQKRSGEKAMYKGPTTLLKVEARRAVTAAFRIVEYDMHFIFHVRMCLRQGTLYDYYDAQKGLVCAQSLFAPNKPRYHLENFLPYTSLPPTTSKIVCARLHASKGRVIAKGE